MKHLLEIAKIVTKKKVKKIEIFDDYSLKQKNSKFNDFYELLMSGSLTTDQEAAQILYDSRPTDDKYRQLKSRFKKRLLNTLFFLDVNQSSTANYNRAHYACNRDWTLVKILRSHKAYQTGAQLARSILSVALKFSFADIVVSAARILREHAAIEGNENLFNEYNELCATYQGIVAVEIESEEHYQRIFIHRKRPLHKLQPLLPSIGEHCKRLVELDRQHPSPVLFYNRCIAQSFYYEALHDYQQVLQICQEAEDHIAVHSHLYRTDQMATLARKKLLALLHLGQYEEGLAQSEQFAQLYERHDAWLAIMEVRLLLALHGKQYDIAHATFELVYGSKRYKQLSEDETAKWQAFEAYLCFLRWLDAGVDAPRPKRYKQFRVKRFLEEPVIFPKQHRVFTVTAVITQVLFLLEQKRWGEAFERIERLRDYSSRLLRQEEHLRIMQFIRLLQQLAKAHFDFENIGVYQKYLDKLATHPIHFRGGINDLEILPYDQLWHTVLTLSRQHATN